MQLRQSVRVALGDALYTKLQIYRRRRANERFAATQTAKEINIGSFLLSAPSNHILFRIQAKQPFRDLAVGILARELARKYPGEDLVDIGANIGDTAAMMATYSPSPIVLAEPSEFYCRFLRENTSRIPNRTTIHPVMISGKIREQGVLMHAGGTARFEALKESGTWIECKHLAEIAGESPCMIKIDTDGFDLPILAASLDYLAQRRPCLFYENEVTDAETLTRANQVVEGLSAIGYRHFGVFDDTGLHVVSTTDPGVLSDINRYSCKTRMGPQERDLQYYDILCASDADRDVFASVMEYYKHY